MDTQEISYVIIGTKQPDLEDVKKKDLNNYLPLWKQEVIIIFKTVFIYFMDNPSYFYIIYIIIFLI